MVPNYVTILFIGLLHESLAIVLSCASRVHRLARNTSIFKSFHHFSCTELAHCTIII